ncbi:MAG: acetoacetate--CoA ligase [Halobacteriovoraceae bacterium]|nr:acetoacetate--CoA ligase [Halobacteriovoraceae bacterium]
MIWRPRKAEVENNNLTKFTKTLSSKFDKSFNNYQELHQFTCDNKVAFWQELINFFDVRFSGTSDMSSPCNEFIPYGWFPGMTLNFAENLLKKGEESDTAIKFFHESGVNLNVSYKELKESTGRLQGHLKNKIKKGDVVAAYMPNIPETVVSMLATTSLGGVFTSTSPDFGVEGVVDRFGQSNPTVLICALNYSYNGKTINQVEKIKSIKEQVPSIKEVIIVDFLGTGDQHEFTDWKDALKNEKTLEFISCKFSDPLYVMYSSGTTGKPKCMVHSVGGTLLQHIKEHGLHGEMDQDKTTFFFTTCGWMMWNWLVSGLYFGGSIVLYEGSPGYPSLGEYLSIINKADINFFGTSPKFLRALEDSKIDIPSPFPSLRSVMSTGAPLLPEQFDFIHEKIKKCHIASISGGTDIIGCFMLGNPNLPVSRGEIQCLGLGMDVDSWNEMGESLRESEGELVCKSPFVSMPIHFLNDDKNSRYKSAYFDKFEGVWHHGDFITITESGGVLVHGRSDATLNPGGVRIGTAEIYRQTETIEYLEDSICVGRPTDDGDVEIVLFVKMKSGLSLDEVKISEIKKLIKDKTTPRHVPKEVIAVGDIPYTRSGKKMELAVTRLIQGKKLTNIEAVSNPKSLDFFRLV